MGNEARVSDAMTAEVCAISEDDRLSIAEDIMRLGRIRHLPVVSDEDELVGILSQRDLFRSALARSIGYGEVAQTHIIESLDVKEVMTTKVVTVNQNASLVDAAQTMLDHKIGCLVVMDDAKITGILTESDFVKLHAQA